MYIIYVYIIYILYIQGQLLLMIFFLMCVVIYVYTAFIKAKDWPVKK